MPCSPSRRSLASLHISGSPTITGTMCVSPGITGRPAALSTDLLPEGCERPTNAPWYVLRFVPKFVENSRENRWPMAHHPTKAPDGVEITYDAFVTCHDDVSVWFRHFTRDRSAEEVVAGDAARMSP